MHPLL